MDATPHSRLTLVLGPTNSGKMGHVLEWWSERLARQAVVVVPTVPTARELSLEMAGRTGGLVGQSPAVTFEGLVRLILRCAPRYATGFQRALLIARLLQSTPLEALESASRLPGTGVALSTLFQQLGESGRTPDEVDRILARWADSDPVVAPLAGDLRRLFLAYVETCAGLGLTDGPGAVREAIGAVKGWSRPVALYGFTSFTPGQRALVEELSRDAEVLVVFTYDRSRSVNLVTPAEIAWWEARAAQVVEAAPLTRAYGSPAVAYLEQHFMSDGPRPEPPPAFSESEGVHFLLASGQRAEAELAAERIADLIRTGTRPRDIAVVVRQVRRWSGLLADVFDSCGISYQMDDRPVLGETGLGHAFLNALKGVALDDPGRILSYLRSPYSGVSLESSSRLELDYRRGVAKGARVLAAIAEGIGLDAVGELWKMVDPRSAGSDGRVVSFDPDAAGSLGRRMLAAGLRGLAVGSKEMEEDARAFQALRAALAALAELSVTPDIAAASASRWHLGGEPSGWPDPRLVANLLARVSVPGGRSEDGEGVQILSVQRARARRFDAVLVLGLVEGEFPGRPDVASLLSPRQRARLDAMGGGFLPPETDQESALFVSAVSRARRTVLLSARDAEDDGSESARSRFWDTAKTLLGVGDGDHESRTLADQVFAPQRAPSLRHYLRACASCGQTPHAEIARSSPQPATHPWVGPASSLTSPAVLAELGDTKSFSPSALEAYAGCPFKWFVERVIGIEELDSELDGRSIGQLAHSVLSETYRELARTGALPLREQGIPGAERTASAIIDRLVEGEECPGTPSERRVAAWRLKRMARSLFEMEASSQGGLVLYGTEMDVGGNQGVDISGLSVRGRVDRVDVTPDGHGLFVYDYKTGAIPAPTALGTEEGLQLPLYLMALAAERPEDTIVGGAYLSLSEKKRAGVVMAGADEALGSGVQGCRLLDEEGAEELFRTTLEAAQRAAAGMRAGVIKTRADRDCPPWCRLGPACRARREGYRP